ncbi:MAG: ribosome small subunit-dependent GTPase, partial [Chloroflexales bacterium]|nr:ribosome small subunit-dependent GTPase [Chloroflexales bacterium]
MSTRSAEASLSEPEAPPSRPERVTGMVLRAQSGFFWVQT